MMKYSTFQLSIFIILLALGMLMPSRLTQVFIIGNEVADINLYIFSLIIYGIIISINKKPVIIVLIMLFNLFIILSMLHGNVYDLALRMIGIFSPVFSFYIIVCNAKKLGFSKSEKLFSVVYWTGVLIITIGALAFFFSSVANYLGLQPITSIDKGRIISVFGGPIATAFAIITLLYMTMIKAKFKNSRLHFFIMPFLFVVLITTGSRLSLLSFMIGIFVKLLIDRKSFFSKKTWFAIIALVILIFGYASTGLNERSFNAELKEGDTYRFFSAQTAIRTLVDTNLLGAGPGNLYVPNRKFERGISMDNIIFSESGYSLLEPHNSYLFILAEMGVITFIFYVSILFILFKKTYYAVDQEQKYILLALLVSIGLHQVGGSHLILSMKLSIFLFSSLAAIYVVNINRNKNEY